jgi:hypothetical protein
MSVINNGFRIWLACLFTPAAHDLLPYGSRPTSHLPQQGILLLIGCLCGIAVAGPVLAFVSFVVGWVVYEFRKRKVESGKAKSQAMVAAMLSLVLLVILGCALVAYFFRDLYIP